MRNGRVIVAGSPIDNVGMDGAVRYAETMIEEGQQCTILAVNPEKVIAARETPELHACLNSAGLLIADGIGMILAARLHGLNFKERVPGSELMPRLCEMAAENGHSVFLYGAKEGVNKQAAEKLAQQYPGLVIAGRQDGYVAKEGMSALVDKINASGAKLLFVALGSPRQEYWITEHKSELSPLVIQGVGGTFDVISGSVKRAPKLWRAIHLEWLYRLLSQPQRFLRQTRLPAFVWLVLCDRMGLVKI